MGQSSILFNISWLIIILSILSVSLVPLRFKAIVAAIGVVINALVTSYMALPAISGGLVEITLNAGTIIGNVPIRIDGLSAWFILVINLTSITGVFYGIGYMKAYSSSSTKITFHWILFLMFHLSMVWVCMVQHGLLFLLVWEVMSLTSMLLVIFDHNNPKTLKAGLNYLIQMHISVIFLSVGFILVYSKTGSFNFESIQTFFNSNSNIWLFLIFFVGFGLKAGFIPLHSWLPHAHPSAPSHISGVMSGVIVKLGIYGIIRIITYLRSDYLLLGEIVVTISLLTGIYGILNAAVHRDFKRMLAYCTIENIGIIGIGIGIGLIGMGNNSPTLYYLGFSGALLHVLNHSLFKSLLFYSAGSVYQQTHTRNMDKLGGLIKKMPNTAFVFLIGSIAIAGLPPLNGFVSEFIIYSGLLEGIKSSNMSQVSLLILTFAGLSIIGGLSILTFTKTFGTIFLGTEREPSHQEPVEVASSMLIPQYFIICIMLSIGFFPQFYLSIIGTLLRNMGNLNVDYESSFPGNFSLITKNITVYSFGFVLFICLLLFIRSRVIVGKKQVLGTTWGCGYVGPTTKMQYSGKSFSKPLGKTFNFILIEKKKYKELEKDEIFPEKREYASYYLDFFEHNIIDKITQPLIYSVNYFKFIQNGRIQTYVLYGIIFILSIIIISVLNIIQ